MFSPGHRGSNWMLGTSNALFVCKAVSEGFVYLECFVRLVLFCVCKLYPGSCRHTQTCMSHVHRCTFANRVANERNRTATVCVPQAS